MINFLKTELAELEKNGLLRRLRTVEYLDGMKARVDGQECVVFCSNDYLGLARDERIQTAAAKAAREYGAGSGASRLVCGDLSIHRELERALAAFKGTEAAVVFPTGYQANVGVITALVNKEDVVICDRLDHASIIDACRLSGAKLLVYPHADLDGLKNCLKTGRGYQRRLIVTDSVFSMDGDSAPLAGICDLAQEYDALVMVDEAHATGVLGKQGQGLAHHLGVDKKIDAHMGTLSKALGSQGGYVAGSQELITYLHNKARSFIYTTALNPAACAAARQAIKLLEQEQAGLDILRDNTRQLRQGLAQAGLEVATEGTPIIPVVIGEERQALSLSAKLLEAGYFVPAIRPPTVPKGTSRLRITVSAAHTQEEIEGLIQSVKYKR